MNHHGTRLPIFHDDLNFRDRNFDDLSRHMQDDLARHGFGSTAGRMFPKWNIDDEMGSIMHDNFFDLRPRNPKLSNLRRDDTDTGSRESLDDDTLNGLYKTNPNNQSRKFEISFDVKDYDPNEISLKVQDDALIVEARHVAMREGGKSQKEFNRKIAIPKDVDIDKLTSTLSNDGILTVHAPVPPKYHEVTYQRPQVSPNPIPLPAGQRVVTEAYIPPSHGSPRNSQTYHSPRSSGSYTSSHSPGSYQQPQGGSQTQSPRDYQQAPRDYQQAPRDYQQPTGAYQQSPGAYQQSLGGYQKSPGGYHSPQGGFYINQQSAQPQSPSSNYGPSQPQQTSIYVQPVLPLDTPVYSNTDNIGGRKMDLMLEVGKTYMPDDLVVKIEGLKLIVDAEHEEKQDGKSSKTSMHREFDLSEDIDSHTVQAMLRTDGKLIITASVKK